MSRFQFRPITIDEMPETPRKQNVLPADDRNGHVQGVIVHIRRKQATLNRSTGTASHFVGYMVDHRILEQALQTCSFLWIGCLSQFHHRQLRRRRLELIESARELASFRHMIRRPLVIIGAEHRGIEVSAHLHIPGMVLCGNGYDKWEMVRKKSDRSANRADRSMLRAASPRISGEGKIPVPALAVSKTGKMPVPPDFGYLTVWKYSLDPTGSGFMVFSPGFQFAGQTSPCLATN